MATHQTIPAPTPPLDSFPRAGSVAQGRFLIQITCLSEVDQASIQTSSFNVGITERHQPEDAPKGRPSTGERSNIELTWGGSRFLLLRGVF